MVQSRCVITLLFPPTSSLLPPFPPSSFLLCLTTVVVRACFGLMQKEEYFSSNFNYITSAVFS